MATSRLDLTDDSALYEAHTCHSATLGSHIP